MISSKKAVTRWKSLRHAERQAIIDAHGLDVAATCDVPRWAVIAQLRTLLAR